MRTIEDFQEAEPNPVDGVSAAPTSAQCQELIDTVARLRAFAVLLCLDGELADELVRITLVRASVILSGESFATNVDDWFINRLRCYYYKEYSGPRELPSLETAPQFASVASAHEAALTALAELPPQQREALILVEALRYRPSAAMRICRMPPGRFKDTLTKARKAFARALSAGSRESVAPSAVVLALFTSAQSAA